MPGSTAEPTTVVLGRGVGGGRDTLTRGDFLIVFRSGGILVGANVGGGRHFGVCSGDGFEKRGNGDFSGKTIKCFV